MVMYAGLEGVGVVGGRLIWSDGRLQHVGIGFEGGLPGHDYRGFHGDYRGYANAVCIARNCLGVTAACLMTPRRTFEEVGGMTTTLPLNFNDVDFCLKVHVRGERIVYDPDLVMYHFESSSRDPEVRAWEIDQLRDRWEGVAAIDPYGNPNLRNGLPRIPAYFSWTRRRPAPTWRRQRLRLEPIR
jgi:GT2 family glycosyltransferase